MSVYQKGFSILERYFKPSSIFKHGLNLSPMYRRTTGRIVSISDDMRQVKVRIPISYRNRNYAGSIFGGSLFSATDPICMVQFVRILGNNFIVWDKSSTIRFKRPAYQEVYAHSEIKEADLEHIKAVVKEKGETDFTMHLHITDKERTVVYSEIQKVIYIADKAFYKAKRKAKGQ